MPQKHHVRRQTRQRRLKAAWWDSYRSLQRTLEKPLLRGSCDLATKHWLSGEQAPKLAQIRKEHMALTSQSSIPASAEAEALYPAISVTSPESCSQRAFNLPCSSEDPSAWPRSVTCSRKAQAASGCPEKRVSSRHQHCSSKQGNRASCDSSDQGTVDCYQGQLSAQVLLI